MYILTIIVVGTLNIVCFFVGAKVGQTVSRDEKLTMPKINLNPMKAYREHRELKEAEIEKNRMDIILGNIERYDGTANCQEDVPR